MRNFYLLLLLLLTFGFIEAQIVNIPDANFKNTLVNTNCVVTFINGSVPTEDVDTNDDGEIQVSEALAVQVLFVPGDNISDLTGIEAFTNLERFNCNENNINSVDFSSNTSLRVISINDNNLQALDLSANPNIENLQCTNNQLETLSFPPNSALEVLNTYNNPITSIDVTNCLELFYLLCDNNNLSSLDLSENENLSELNCLNNNISALELSNNTLLTNLNCYNNPITSLDLSQNIILEQLYCANNQLVTLITNSPFLDTIHCEDNMIETLDISTNSNLRHLYCSNNALTSLDISGNILLRTLVADNNDLINLFLKNESCFLNYLGFDNNPNLSFVCIDVGPQNGCSDQIQVMQRLQEYGYFDVVVNSYCSFVPGGDYSLVTGNVRNDLNNTGCDVNDEIVPYLKLNVNNGFSEDTFFSNSNGNYNIPLQDGMYTITPQLENLDYYVASPSSIVVNFPLDESPINQDFCIVPDGVHNDLEVMIIPLDEARPGFEVHYKLVYKNKGNTVLSGSIDFSFDDNVMNFITANPIQDAQTIGSLTWSYIDITPFETREIEFAMFLNTPTDENFPLVADDILEYTASIIPNDADETPDDNTFVLNQTVVNSFDPNDKRCLEGETITLDMVGRYVHYMVRFENTGTANAINVVVKDEIDTNKLDINTLIPLNASHDFVTRIQNTNEVEFIFENINLPFDDANNDGYVVFKIKTLEALTIGDNFNNDAEIYFDFNFPIITNNYTTTVEDNLSVNELESDSKIKLYPNPVTDVFQIASDVTINSAVIYDINGRQLQTIVFLGNETERRVDIKQLSKGIYFVKIISNEKETLEKIIKN